jgi:hypothetical protein
MQIPDHILPYLNGEKFTNSLSLDIPFKGIIPSRLNFLTELSRNKRVVHLGCLDHKELIQEKIKNRIWLHGLLNEVATECVGIDIEQETLNYLKQLGEKTDNIFIADMLKDEVDYISERKWDYAILGELLEHIDNPVQFLASIRSHYKDSIQQIIITVPNAFTQSNFRKANAGKEFINSDHRYWFSVYTLAKVMNQAGIIPQSFHFVNRVQLQTHELVKKKILSFVGKECKYNYTYASSIVAVGNI